MAKFKNTISIIALLLVVAVMIFVFGPIAMYFSAFIFCAVVAFGVLKMASMGPFGIFIGVILSIVCTVPTVSVFAEASSLFGYNAVYMNDTVQDAVDEFRVNQHNIRTRINYSSELKQKLDQLGNTPAMITNSINIFGDAVNAQVNKAIDSVNGSTGDMFPNIPVIPALPDLLGGDTHSNPNSGSSVSSHGQATNDK